MNRVWKIVTASIMLLIPSQWGSSACSIPHHPADYCPRGAEAFYPVGGKISSVYGPRGDSGDHCGMDIDTTTEGHVVVAVKTGDVFRSGESVGYGNYVELYHPQIVNHDSSSLYAHLLQRDVVEGQHVLRGVRIGLSGDTGHSTGPHLHFEFRDSNNKPFNPMCRMFVKKERGERIYSTEIIRHVPTSTTTVNWPGDPNYMYGPDGYVTSGQAMEYTVEFENEGLGTERISYRAVV
jgi:murein DD-endopeptidase MepM/ murein hydrolase activator NlpD